MQESAYAHLGNALVVLNSLLSEDSRGIPGPPCTQCVTVSMDDLLAIRTRIVKAREVIHLFALTMTGGTHV